MPNKSEVVAFIIKEMKENPQNFSFNYNSCTNLKSFDKPLRINVYKTSIEAPVELRLSFFQKMKLRKAMEALKADIILLNKEE